MLFGELLEHVRDLADQRGVAAERRVDEVGLQRAGTLPEVDRDRGFGHDLDQCTG
jgi:hypothetical protein